MRTPRAAPAMLRKSLATVLCATAIALRPGLPGPGGAALDGQERGLEIDRFHADIEVHENGDVDVLEQLTLRFEGSWNGIIRTIPIEYRTPEGLQYRLFVNVDRITSETGEELWYEASRDGIYRRLKIRVPDARDAVRTVHIRYHMPNALQFFDEHDELYWNVTGSEWPFTIREASARVTLPDAVRNRRGTAFVGGYGSMEQGRVQEIEEGFYFETPRGLGIREGLTVGVAWDPGVVERPGLLERATWFLRSNWPFLLPFVTLVLMWRIWWTRGRDPARRPVAPRYEPPSELGPAEAGTLIDNRPDMRDITAMIVGLAVEGHLRIEETEEEKLFGLTSETGYRFVRTEPDEDAEELSPAEAAVLRALFDGTSQVQMSDLEHQFYEDLGPIRDRIFDRLVSLGLYQRRPDHVMALWMVIGAVTLVAGIVGAVVAYRVLLLPLGWTILAAVLAAVPVFAFGAIMPARTRAGARKLEEILGFQEFLDRVESDRFRRMIDSPEAFERYLPYAMAFGVDKRWARAFEDIYTEPPRWYVGTHPSGFHTTSFVGQLGSWSSRAGTVLASQPRSTGGSAFGGGSGGFGGGGGFSGGGFGGGGGGGW